MLATTMETRVKEKIKKLEQEVATLWGIVEDERLWHPSVIREIKRRSRFARRDHAEGRLRKTADVFAALARH